jgi:outer membrane receptor for ferrienterochelin and colicins
VKIIRFALIIFLHLSFVIFNLSFADELPLFYADEVVVTATRIPRLQSSIPWNTKIITREEIEESSSVKLGDILRSASGLSVKANGGSSSQISARFRGSNSQQVLVLLNGNRINSPSLGTFDLGDVLLTDVEKIEVVKAPLSAVYGADAVGGVVNVITKRAAEKPELKISAEFGEFAAQNYSVSGSGPNYFFSASTLNSNGFRDNSDYQAKDFSVRFSGGYLEAGVKKYEAEKGSPGSLDFLTPQARQNDNNLFYDLNYEVEEIGLKASLSRSLLDQKYENPAWGILSTHKTTTTNLNIQEAIDRFNFHTLVLGAEIRNDKSESTNSGDHEISNSAVYAQDEIEIPGFIKIVLGGRGDFSSAYGNQFNPRVGCVFNPWKDILFKASWGTSFKAPTIDDLYWTRTTEPGWPTGLITTEGNPGLKSETAQSYDVSLERKFDPQSSARLSYYLTHIKDMIRWTNISSSLTDAYWRPTNVSNAAIQGVEFEYEREIFDKLRGFMNFTYQSAKDEDSGRFLDYAPQTQYNAGVKYVYKKGLTSNFIVKHIGERYADLANTIKLPSYTVVDFSLARGFMHWAIKLDVENLFDENYAETYGFSDVYPMPGRRYNIGVSYKI